MNPAGDIIVFLNPGEYFVTVSDFSGASCSGVSDTFALTVTPRPSISLAGPGEVNGPGWVDEPAD